LDEEEKETVFHLLCISPALDQKRKNYLEEYYD